MEKQRIMLFGGFLGSGKTTTMISLAGYLKKRGVSAALITNDLGSNLVDTNFVRMEGIPVAEIPNGCLCHDVDHFTQTAFALEEEYSPDIILAEPVGSCVNLVRNVYAEMRERFDETFSLAPFTAVVDPARFRAIYMGIGENTFDEWPEYMFKKQLEEADVLLLNKADTLSAQDAEETEEALRKYFPEAEAFVVSAATQHNYGAWAELFLHGQESHVKELDIDWDYVVTGERRMGWYNQVTELQAGKAFDYSAFCHTLMQELQTDFAGREIEIAHLKLLCSAGEGYLKAALTTTRGEIVYTGGLEQKEKRAQLNINVRALVEPEGLAELIETTLERCAGAAGLAVSRSEVQAFDSFDEAPNPSVTCCGGE